MTKQKYAKDVWRTTLGDESLLDLSCKVGSPGWSPISLSRRCWLRSLHLLGWVWRTHAQWFSTAQRTYAEHGSQVLLDVLVVEHGLQGSLWKIHLELSWMREIWMKCQLRKKHPKTRPANYVLKDTLCRMTVDPRLSSLDPALSPHAHSSSGSWIQFQVRSLLCKCHLTHVPDSPLMGDRSKGRQAPSVKSDIMMLILLSNSRIFLNSSMVMWLASAAFHHSFKIL